MSDICGKENDYPILEKCKPLYMVVQAMRWNDSVDVLDPILVSASQTASGWEIGDPLVNDGIGPLLYRSA